MLKRRVSILAIIAILSNSFVTPVNAFSESLLTRNTTENIVQDKKVSISKFNLYGSTKLEDYNSVYKIDKSNIKSITNNGGQYSNSSIDKAIDGSFSTHWETGKPNSANFTNEVVVDFNKVESLDRIVYAARQDSAKGKGFAKEVEIYSSMTDGGNDFELVGTSTYTGSTGDVVEIKFNNTSFKRLKFVFKKANQDWASSAEFMFYKEDKVYDLVNNLFTNGLNNELREDINSLEKIEALEEQLKEYPLRDEYIGQIELAKDILENPTKYQDGILIASQRGDSNKEAREHQIARTTYNLDTYGKYVTPGETIKVYVDADINGVMPQLVLGQLANDKNGWTRFYNLKPGLNSIKAPEYSTMSPAVMYIYNPALPSDQSYAPRVRIEGGTKFPVYYHGKTNPTEYEKELQEYTQKISVDDNDFASGVNNDVYYNVTELVSENNIITTSAAGALQGIKEMKSSNKTVEDTMNDWEKLWNEFQKFSGFAEGDLDPRNDIYNAKFISRVFTKGPYGWSDWGYTGYNGGNTARRDSSNFKQIVKPFNLSDDWLFYHEWGHSINNSWTEEVEVTNNLYSAQMRRIFGTGGNETDRIDWDTLYSRFSGKIVPSGYFTNLGMISQPLYYYGVDTYGKASKIARTNPDGVLNGLTNNKQRLVITYSLAVGYDLTDYFEGWNYCKATDLMKSKVSHLKKPDVKLEYMNTSGIEYKGEGFTRETITYINNISSNTELKQTTLNFSVDEANKNDVMGYEIFRDGEVVGYTTRNSFVDKNIDITKNYTYEVVAYAKDLTTSKKATISSKTPTLLSNNKITLKLNEEFNPLKYVNAVDSLGNAILDVNVNHNVDTTKKGIYNVAYEVISNDITVNKKAVVEVVSDYDYLSDSNWTSARTDYDVIRKNSNLKLFVNGKVQNFAKGFGAHANAEIVYDLSGKNYDKFEAFIGVNRAIEAQNNSSIKFSILADGKEIYNSGLMKYADAAKFVSVDVKEVKELKIVVNDGGNGISSDHAVIGNPILIDNNIKPKLNIPKSVSTKVGHQIDLKEEYSAHDSEDGDLTANIEVSGEVNFDRTGEYTLTYKVADNDGNVVTKTRTVAVVDMKDYTYLTDYNWKSENHSYSATNVDKSISLKTLRLTDESGKEVSYSRGLGAHATSSVVYDLSDKNYDYFTSYVGVDRQMYESIGSVSFEVYVDGEKKFDSGLMNSKDPQKYVEVDINGARELKLVVTDGGNNIGSDHATWADTKLHYAKENGTIINKEELNSLINTVNELKAESYKVESFNNLKVVLENVNKELANGYSQEEINNLYTDLKKVYDTLVKLTDFSSLEEAIFKYSNYNELHYFKDVVIAHKAVIVEAKLVLANKDATQEEIDAVTAKVIESANTLVVRENKVELENKLNEAKSIKNNNYNSVRWGNFCYAIKYAEEIYNNVNATDEEVRSAIFTLQYFKEEL